MPFNQLYSYEFITKPSYSKLTYASIDKNALFAYNKDTDKVLSDRRLAPCVVKNNRYIGRVGGYFFMLTM